LTCLAALALAATGCAEGSVTSTSMALYESTEHGFSVEYPEGWTESTWDMGAEFSFSFADPESSLVISVYLSYPCGEITQADFVSEGKTYLQSLPDYSLISERQVTTDDGTPGREIVARGDMGKGEVEKFRFVIVTRDKQGFWVGVSGMPSDFDQQSQTIDAIAESFSLLPDYTFNAPEPWPGGTYSDSGYGFTITIPEGWCQYPPLRSEHILYFAPPEQDPSLHISVQDLPEDTTPAEYIENVLEELPTTPYWTNFQMVSQRSASVSGASRAHEIVFTGMSDLSPGYNLKCKYIIAFKGERVYWVMMASYAHLYQQHTQTINEIVYSFRLN
jgi:hypothetical protein